MGPIALKPIPKNKQEVWGVKLLKQENPVDIVTSG